MVVNINLRLMFENKAVVFISRHRRGNVWRHIGIWWDMEGTPELCSLSGSCVSNIVKHSDINIRGSSPAPFPELGKAYFARIGFMNAANQFISKGVSHFRLDIANI